MDPKSMFEGLGVALITPFREGAVDREALARLAGHLAESGVRALYPCGCTGEATSLTRVVRTFVIRTVIVVASGRAAEALGLAGTVLAGAAESSFRTTWSGVPGRSVRALAISSSCLALVISAA